MREIFVLVDTENKTVALYDSEDLAKTLKPLIEEKLKTTLTLSKKTVNLPIAYIGVIE